MAKRTYRQYCFLAQALDLVGERWTLLVIRELLLGPRRFKDLLHGLPGIGTNLLSARLKELEASGLVRRATLPPPAGSSVYDLTDYGQELWPAVVELTRWGSKAVDSSEDKIFRSEWGLLVFKAMFRPEAARGIKDTYEYRVDGEVFHVRVDDGTVETAEGRAVDPDVVLTTDAATFLALGSGRLSAPDAVAEGRATIDGDPEALRRARKVFWLESDESAGSPAEPTTSR